MCEVEKIDMVTYIRYMVLFVERVEPDDEF